MIPDPAPGERQHRIAEAHVPRVAMVVSSDAGSGLGARALMDRLTSAGAQVEAFDRERLEAVAESRSDRIAVAGGDGSVGPAAELAARLGVPLAVLPTGTANNFAAVEGVPADIDEACRLAARGERTREVDLGLAGELPFVNLASAGLAPVAAERAASWKRVLGASAYAAGAAAAALTAKPVECVVRTEDARAFKGSAWQVMVAVSGAFGPGIRIERVDPRDGALDLVVLEAGHRAELLRRGWWIRQGRIASQPRAVRTRARSFDVEVPAATRFNVDGEVVALGATRFTVAPSAFRLVIP